MYIFIGTHISEIPFWLFSALFKNLKETNFGVQVVFGFQNCMKESVSLEHVLFEISRTWVGA